MSITDADRWNRRYQSLTYDKLNQPRRILVENQNILPRSGKALDIACGLGQNSRFLLKKGLDVVAVDISINALNRLHKSEPEVNAVLADLDSFILPTNYFSVITNFYYFDAQLFGILSEKLIKGGIIFIESLTENMIDIKPDIEKDHLLKPGELIFYFNKLAVLYYYEGWLFEENGKQKAVAQLIARKL